MLIDHTEPDSGYCEIINESANVGRALEVLEDLWSRTKYHVEEIPGEEAIEVTFDVHLYSAAEDRQVVW